MERTVTEGRTRPGRRPFASGLRATAKTLARLRSLSRSPLRSTAAVSFESPLGVGVEADKDGPVMTVRYALDGSIAFASGSEAILGYPPEALLGRKTHELVHPDDIVPLRVHKLALRLHPLRDDEAAPTIAYRLRRAAGGWAWVQGSPRALFDPETGWALETQDVLRDDPSRNAPGTVLAAGLPDPGPGGRLATSEPPAEGSVSIPSDATPGPVRLHDLLTASLDDAEAHARARALTLSLHLETALPDRVVLKALDVRRLLTGLLDHALASTDDGGVRLSAQYDAARQRLRCEVMDTGCGVAADAMATLFDPPAAGAVTGPPASKALTRALGGEMGVVSLAGLGACFWFEIPCPTASSAAPEAHEAFSLAGLRVLVADDNAANRDLVRLMLSTFGVVVSEASSGEEAVAVAATSAFDAILLDLWMPGLDGAATARLLRQAAGPNGAVPILAFTADDDWADRDDAGASALFDARVSKPLSLEALVSTLAAATAPPPPFVLVAAA